MMPRRLEIALKPDLFDAAGEGVRKKALDYFGIVLDPVRTVNILTIDAALTDDQFERIRTGIFTNPVTQVSSYAPLPVPFDWIILTSYRPGVTDAPGNAAAEAVEALLKIRLKKGEAIYTSRRYCLSGDGLRQRDMDKIAGELLANDIIERWSARSKKDGDEIIREPETGWAVPKVILKRAPAVRTVPADSDDSLMRVSRERNLALNPNDIPVIRAYFSDEKVRAARAEAGLSDPTDIELEYISQARSDHCNHNTFRGFFRYSEKNGSFCETIDNLFKTCVERPTLELKAKKPWVASVLWDNAGAGRFDDGHYYVITGETHNSPSNMEAYGGAITGIVGVYRDPMGTGKGSRLIMGAYGYCVGPADYDGDLRPRLHPRRLLDGVIEGVRDGGNKSGVPTPFGQVVFDPGYMGKCLVFVTAVGIMPSLIKGEPSEKKTTSPGDFVIMCGGRVGKDGIHGVTASSETFSDNTPAGHVQIGDPYTQKKMHDFLLEARDEGLVSFITDNGGGGLSSSVGESALFSNGCEIDLEKVPLKYEGLDQWEIWVSESQERMTVAVAPDHLERFMALSQKHAVESSVIGVYTDSGKLRIKYNGQTCACVDLDFLSSGFPQWEFDAEWISPRDRGMVEPVLSEPKNYRNLLTDMLSGPNICSREWIARQYDHEVQGASVLKPLTGKDRDIPGDAAVIRPIPDSSKGIAFSQALLPFYSEIDAYHMTACVMDEALRRLLAVGGDPDHVGGVDNFCWPDIAFDPVKNPDGTFKAAQLVRSCRALADMCRAFEIPLLSGKDSMYVDGHLKGRYGETRKVSALCTLQFSGISVLDDVTRCVSMDFKMPGDVIYAVGTVRNELGASEYYQRLGHTGLNVPQVRPEAFIPLYRAVSLAIQRGLAASVHGIYRGGFGVHLALSAMGGNLGADVDLSRLTRDMDAAFERNDVLLFSESPGRFILTADKKNAADLEEIFQGLPFAAAGSVKEKPEISVTGLGGDVIMSAPVAELKAAWKRPFGKLI
ncbi:Phosphoribosylformylglycinamidine synthase subunit PurL [Candidatus Desulfarcum epimagneticum]|uniref:Phosphoribosylformylglycinamidine synthase subunit PurL n=1 Tax=uncultured Desulfobacteraceae bacterium TaxID=218296 RepID=A0A484HI74_9BACT|nr:Phosphoribosylformylglycinamidine synthase subunit PurL [uncultured Desulfobacteraceae bacterium]